MTIGRPVPGTPGGMYDDLYDVWTKILGGLTGGCTSMVYWFVVRAQKYVFVFKCGNGLVSLLFS